MLIAPKPAAHFGQGAIKELPGIVRATGADGVMLVTDPGVAATPVLGAVTHELAGAEIPVHVFPGVHPNPTTDDIAAGAEAVQLVGARRVALVAIGGGSPIDAAKGIAIAAVNPERGRELDYRSEFAMPALPIVAVPTTAGTGAETNAFGVVTDPLTYRKFYVGHASSMPAAAIGDPALTTGLPWTVTAATGMDALTHALESYLSANPNSWSDGIDLQVIRLIAVNLPRACADGGDLPARYQMLLAAHMAGVAMANTGLGICHAIGHALGGRWNIAHGVTLSMILPDVLRYNLPVRTERMADIAFALGVGDTRAGTERNAAAVIDAVAALRETVGITQRLADFGITAADHEGIAAAALDDEVLANTPRQPTAEDIAAILGAPLPGDRAHQPAADAVARSMGKTSAVPATLITRIGELVTNEDGFHAIENGALVIEDGVVAWTGPSSRAPAADSLVDAGRRVVLPGFVDSHAHLVFGGERSAEFAARMAGRSYAAGGILTTVKATRAASDAALRANLRRLADEMLSQGTTTFECKSGYGLTVTDEERGVALAAEVTPEVTFLGAHVVPPEYAADLRGYVDLVCGPMLKACAPHVRWIDVFCEDGAFAADEAAEILAAGRAAGLSGRIHANQLGPGPGVQVAAQAGAVAADHCTYLTAADVDAIVSTGMVATLLPGAEFSTRHPYPDARRLLDAGAIVALATDCNPGSSFTSSMAFCIALAVREMRMTTEEAVWSATAGGARALRRDDIGKLTPGARADLIMLDAPSHAYLAYRPGVPLIAAVWRGGELTRGEPAV